MLARSTISRIAVLGALGAALALPAAAAAEYYVPPGNSAANQYTETLPSAGGDSAGKKQKVTPADAIGAANAKQLEQRGPSGKAAAELAAETAPAPVVNVEAESEEGSGGGAAGGASGSDGNGGSGNAGTGGGANDGGGTATVNGNAGQGAGNLSPATAPDSSGSSGFGSVLGEATGFSDSGALGLWLPIAILAALIVAVAHRIRILRHKPAA